MRETQRRRTAATKARVTASKRTRATAKKGAKKTPAKKAAVKKTPAKKPASKASAAPRWRLAIEELMRKNDACAHERARVRRHMRKFATLEEALAGASHSDRSYWVSNLLCYLGLNDPAEEIKDTYANLRRMIESFALTHDGKMPFRRLPAADMIASPHFKKVLSALAAVRLPASAS